MTTSKTDPNVVNKKRYETFDKPKPSLRRCAADPPSSRSGPNPDSKRNCDPSPPGKAYSSLVALGLVPRTRAAWAKERQRCEARVARACVEDHKMSCAIRSEKVCALAGRGTFEETSSSPWRWFGLGSNFEVGRRAAGRQPRGSGGEGECEDKIFRACVSDLERACEEKASESCGRAFGTFSRRNGR